jgi:hypothetical protein
MGRPPTNYKIPNIRHQKGTNYHNKQWCFVMLLNTKGKERRITWYHHQKGTKYKMTITKKVPTTVTNVRRCWWILMLLLLRSLMEHVYHVSSAGFVISATTMCMNVAIVKMTKSFNESNFVECDIRSVFKL